MRHLNALPNKSRAAVLRELERAQMIVASPKGTWPGSLVELSKKMLRQWAGWNVTPITAASPGSFFTTPMCKWGSKEIAEFVAAYTEMPMLGEIQ